MGRATQEAVAPTTAASLIQKPRPTKRGRAVMQEMTALQESTDFMLKRTSMIRVCREALAKQNSAVTRFTGNAYTALQEASEAVIHLVFTNALDVRPRDAKGKTLTLKKDDMDRALRIMRRANPELRL